ncbi:protein artichoke-like [Prorops nasuta]|uniref:protein artichoke-like n=1 Tax=Prorops nasuta TaxID=863751 RepID=UPI0034CF275D
MPELYMMFELRKALSVYILAGLLLASTVSCYESQWRPCVELKGDLRLPCKCSITPRTQRTALDMNCDNAVLTAEHRGSLGLYIRSFSHRNGGHVKLPESLLLSVPNIRKLDLSANSMYKLSSKVLASLNHLIELRLANNFLGDSLNPIFSGNEFHEAHTLKLLDLRGNRLRSLEEGIFKGCWSLEELLMDRNEFSEVPAASLKGPKSLRLLSLSGNKIVSLTRAALSTLGETLLHLDLSNNELSHMEDEALSGLDHLLFLNISHNDLNRFNSDVFKGANSLLQLDLSANLLQDFPTYALRHLVDLKFLNISNNLITEIEQSHLSGLGELQVLDLSRNNIGRLGINAFSNLGALTRLDLSLNALRTIEESAFEGLSKLRWLSLQDNNILLVPGSALTRLPSLTYLHLEFNRIAALSTELVRSAAATMAKLVLTRNLIREIPSGLFLNFDLLNDIQLSGNMLTSITRDTFMGLEDSLLSLDVSYNRLSSIVDLSLRQLVSLNLAGNQLKKISPESFKYLPRLQYLNLSSNPLYGGFPPVFPSTLISLDISHTSLRILPTILFLNLESLERIYMGGNHLEEIDEGTFQHLTNLTSIDLSGNFIEYIENGAFVGLINLYELNLSGNKLTSFVGEHFNTGTGLEILDLSNNMIDRLSPTAFVIHPRLREINLSGNQFVRFPSDFLKPLQFLEQLDLSHNYLKSINEFAYSQISRLRILNLAENQIESVDDLSFHNSTQLQFLDLSNNALSVLSERSMEGLLRLQLLNLKSNKISTLPEMIFDQSRIREVEKIDLSSNSLNGVPAYSLQKQSSSLISLNLARNKIVEVDTQGIVSNLKELDLSQNPLSEKSIQSVLSETRILRTLNLAKTGIKYISRLEMPFLKSLNVSINEIMDIRPSSLERVSMLEDLDVSRNKLMDLTNLISGLKSLSSFKSLDISGNQLKTINESSLEGLVSLRSLKMSDLLNCTRIERSAFKSLSKLRLLHAYDYPKLGYFDVQGILKGMDNLESVDVEIKDSSIGNEQLSVHSHPRLRQLTLRGERLRSISSSSLVGVRAPKLSLGLKNTSIDAIPAGMFFPIPRSTNVELDVAGSKFKSLPVQLLAALDERSGAISLNGLDSNPISCGCEVKHLWRWLKVTSRGPPEVICRSPDYLSGQLLANLTEEYLSCDRIPTRETTRSHSTFASTPRSTTLFVSSSSEPEIIWTVAPTTQNNRNKYNDHSSPVGSISGTDDTLIIGIVGGVVAFIAIIVIVICICRLRWSNLQANEAQMAAVTSSIHDASMMRPASAYSGKINHDIYVGSYNGSTLDRGNAMMAPSHPATPIQMMPYVHPMHLVHSLTPPPQGAPPPTQPIYGYFENSSLPVYVTCPSENKFDR